MANRLSGGLLQILKMSRIAWYHGVDGNTAYYEQPSPGVPGMVVINGQRIAGLVVDHVGLYADTPSPTVQRILVTRGISLTCGWTCNQPIYGEHLNDAVRQSKYNAARHHNGRVSVQCIDDVRAAIFVDGVRRWTIKAAGASRILGEMHVSLSHGWYPVHHNLLLGR